MSALFASIDNGLGVKNAVRNDDPESVVYPDDGMSERYILDYTGFDTFRDDPVPYLKRLVDTDKESAYKIRYCRLRRKTENGNYQGRTFQHCRIDSPAWVYLLDDVYKARDHNDKIQELSEESPVYLVALLNDLIHEIVSRDKYRNTYHDSHCYSDDFNLIGIHTKNNKLTHRKKQAYLMRFATTTSRPFST